jgi:hypothetical protein
MLEIRASDLQTSDARLLGGLADPEAQATFVPAVPFAVGHGVLAKNGLEVELAAGAPYVVKILGSTQL